MIHLHMRICTALTFIFFASVGYSQNILQQLIDGPLPSANEAATVASNLFNVPLDDVDDIVSGLNYTYNLWTASPELHKEGKCDAYDGGHSGIDIQTKDVVKNRSIDRTFYAVSRGEVIAAGEGDYNTIAVYDNEKDITTLYLHARSIFNLTLGDTISIGQRLGIQGNTGAPGGVHVHFEARRGKFQGYACGAADSSSVDPLLVALEYLKPHSYKKVVDSDTVLPNGHALQCYPGLGLSMDGERAAFMAADGGLLVSESGVIRLVVDSSTVLPGRFRSMSRVYDFAVDGARTYFSTNTGVYADQAGSITLVAELGMTVPGSNLELGGLYNLDAGDGMVVFISEHNDQAHNGVYVADKSGIRTVANINTIDPASNKYFTAKKTKDILNMHLATAGGHVAFWTISGEGNGLHSSVYVWNGSSLSIAESGGHPRSPGLLGIDSSGRTLIYFEVIDSVSPGFPLYDWRGGKTTLVSNAPYLVESTGERVNYMGGYSAVHESGIVIQAGRRDGARGLYELQTGSVRRIIDTSDMLDGKAISKLWTGDVSDGVLFFLAEFSDGKCGLFTTRLSSGHNSEKAAGPSPLREIQPVYPARALSRGIEGYVDVQFTIQPDGTTANPVVVFSTSSLFERSAIRAVLESRYEQSGKITVDVRERVNFTIPQ